MIVSEVVQLFRAYCDEPDATFLTNTDVSSYLREGYDEFRRKISTLDPYIFAIDVDIQVAGEVYDLADVTNAVVLLGPTVGLNPGPPTFPRMMQLIGARLKRTNNTVGSSQLKGTSSLKGLADNYNTYLLMNTRLMFSESLQDEVTLSYIPEQTINWGPTSADFIDNMSQFHDMIALYATKQYQIRDAAINQPLMIQLNQRERDLDTYVVTRNWDGPQYVQRTIDG
tara:strand:+ start:766 stop:1443 length:678 start_codon:yes stop_codon:yes gene_type:complete